MNSLFTPPVSPATEFEAGWNACMAGKPYDETKSADWHDGWQEADLKVSCATWELQHWDGE